MLAIDRTTYTLPDDKLSASRVRSFQTCPACFEMEYILKIPRRVHIALPRGSALHAGVQVARQAVIDEGTYSTEDAVDAAVGVFRAELEKIDPANLDLGANSSYLTPLDAAKDVEALTTAAVEQIVSTEVAIGIAAIEARVDFEGILPFFFDAYADVLLRDGTLKDLKSSGKKVEPDAWARIQLLIYGLPWHHAGQRVQLQIDQVTLPTKTQLTPSVQFHAVESAPANFDAAEKLVLQTAAAISTGIFPARPSWACHYPHGFES